MNWQLVLYHIAQDLGIEFYTEIASEYANFDEGHLVATHIGDRFSNAFDGEMITGIDVDLAFAGKKISVIEELRRRFIAELRRENILNRHLGSITLYEPDLDVRRLVVSVVILPSAKATPLPPPVENLRAFSDGFAIGFE